MGTRRSISRRAGDVVRNSFFSRVVTLSNSVDGKRKIAMRWSHKIHMVWDHTQTEREIRMVCWLGFSCKMYIDSNRRDSQI
jgi:hypothetical protein